MTWVPTTQTREVWTASGKKLESVPVPKPGGAVKHRASFDATWIKAERKRIGLTQNELELRMGLGSGTVSNWENKGRMSGASYKNAKAWFAAYKPEEETKAALEPEVETKAAPEPAPKPAQKQNYKGDPVRAARKKALQMLPAEWGDAKQVAFLAGIEAMEDAIMEELG